MWPWLGARLPAMIENSVVLPAPFGPISAVISPVCAVSEARSSASKPPKRLDTPSTRSSGSAMAALQGGGGGSLGRPESPAQIEQHAGDAARRHRHDQDEHASVDHQVE